MATEFKLPDIGEGVHEGEIVRWHVQPGDPIQADQPMVDVMTDKVTAEIPSPVTGVVRELRAEPGQVVTVGSVIIVFDEAGATPSPPAEAQAAPTPAGNGAAKAPSYGQPAVAAVGAPVLPGAAALATRPLAAPATRQLAKQLGVDLTQVPGSGPAGRITPDDVQARAGQPAAHPAMPAPAPQVGREALVTALTQEAALPAGPAGAVERRVPFVGIRRKIAEHLVASKQRAPHFGYVEEADMTEIVRLRQQLLPHAEAAGVKLTYLPFVIKALVSGLKAYPILNATLDETRQELVYQGVYHIGVAVATEQGLVVPVVHHADQKSILDIAREVQDLSARARANTLDLAQIRGGTFTLTSIGSIGGLFGLPIINYPEVAIMGLNKIAKRPVVKTVDGEDCIVIREMTYLSISCDHRVVDGAEAALFIKHITEVLESPGRLLLV